jgi:hypothetical protein
VGGTEVSKASLKIESYGTIDELNSVMGLARTTAMQPGTPAEIRGESDSTWESIQQHLFDIGSILATERGLTERIRSQRDRRVVEVGIPEAGLALLQELDPHSHQMPKAMLGHLGDEKLRELAELVESAIAEMGTYP